MKLPELLKLNLSTPTLFDYRALRLFVGGVAFFLPFVVLIRSGEFLRSISAYYHSTAGDQFVGALTAIGMLFLAYNGRNGADKPVSKLAGVCALCVAFFSVAPDPNCNECATPSVAPLPAVHYVAAMGLFAILALFCFFFFPNSREERPPDEQLTEKEKRRDRIYYGCGYTICACIVLMLATPLMPEDFVRRVRPFFFLEWFALAAFGFSWITAAQWWRLTFLVDEKSGFHITGSK